MVGLRHVVPTGPMRLQPRHHLGCTPLCASCQLWDGLLLHESKIIHLPLADVIQSGHFLGKIEAPTRSPLMYAIPAGRGKPEIVDYVETYVLNSDKCLALFKP